MEVHKEPALIHYMKKVGQLRENMRLENIIEVLRRDIKELREAYNCLDNKWMTDDNAFLKMMIQDGCFMYEILQPLSQFEPFLGQHGHLKSIIKQDMLLMENQLPLTLLKTLASFQMPGIQGAKLTLYINWLVTLNLGLNNEQVDHGAIKTYKGLHALHLCLGTLFAAAPVEEANSTSSNSAISHCRCPSAMELHQAGVRFKKSDTKHLDDVRFDKKNGTLYLPQLVVHDPTELIFRNMIAFENQLHPNINGKFASYIFLMDEIINTADDVGLLCQSDIILNKMGSNEETALLFNRVTKNMFINISENSMTQVRKDVSSFCGKRINQWRASLNGTYFKSPWSVISLFGALLVILLTITQTICAIIQL